MLHNKLSRKSLGVFIVAGLCVLVIAGTVMGAFDSGNNEGVEWHVQVSSLAYDATERETKSYHQYYIRNNSALSLKFNFEFSHKVYSITDNIEAFVGSDTIDQSAPPGASTLDNGESDINWWWNTVDMSHLSDRTGMYRIRAYTQLRVRSVRHGTETPLFDTPKTSETHDFHIE